MSDAYAAEEDTSPLATGYPASKIGLAILLAAVLHGVLLGSSLLIGPKKQAEQTPAKGTTVSVVGTNSKTGTDTATSTGTSDKKADEPKTPTGTAPKGDASDDLKLDDK